MVYCLPTWQQALTDLRERQQSGDTTIWTDLWHHRFDGRLKLWLTHSLLRERQQQAMLVLEGDCIPLTVESAYSDQVLAFAR